jgi:hypothetical protein
MDPDFFITLDNQLNLNFNIDLVLELLRGGHLKAKDLRLLAKPFSTPTAHGELAAEYDQADSTAKLLTTFERNAEKYEIYFHYKIEDKTARQIDLSVSPAPHLAHFEYRDGEMGDILCRIRKHLLESLTAYGGLPAAEIEEQECHHHGAKRCLYRLKSA